MNKIAINIVTIFLALSVFTSGIRYIPAEVHIPCGLQEGSVCDSDCCKTERESMGKTSCCSVENKTDRDTGDSCEKCNCEKLTAQEKEIIEVFIVTQTYSKIKQNIASGSFIIIPDISEEDESGNSNLRIYHQQIPPDPYGITLVINLNQRKIPASHFS